MKDTKREIRSHKSKKDNTMDKNKKDEQWSTKHNINKEQHEPD